MPKVNTTYIHSEMPEQEEGVMRGFQLWLNLPGKNKLMDASYRDKDATLLNKTDWGSSYRKWNTKVFVRQLFYI